MSCNFLNNERVQPLASMHAKYEVYLSWFETYANVAKVKVDNRETKRRTDRTKQYALYILEKGHKRYSNDLFVIIYFQQNKSINKIMQNW